MAARCASVREAPSRIDFATSGNSRANRRRNVASIAGVAATGAPSRLSVRHW